MAVNESIKAALRALEDEAANVDNLARCFVAAAGGDDGTGQPPWVYQFEDLAHRMCERIEALSKAIHGVPA